ncbi:hypothetical protein QQS45_00095 [Alteriqipengyuania flavescens]|uniref:hypothetical protein n=1 Tax=Alteriqipengyuania flavescens TaxID=3053610 RepID=UPI0025B56C4C|nr:hypothetical protein [Alteriqipengyuania flavescens]WJY24630.1 hypothetical protein QQS45_00095 [Alteriqipengyuania flavescens]
MKAIIRKRYGSISRFVKQNGLPSTGVSDLFRGRTSAPVRKAVERVIRDHDRATGSTQAKKVAQA